MAQPEGAPPPFCIAIVAHQVGVLHRALRPSNVLLSPDGAVWLLDFGMPLLIGAPDLAAAGGAFNSPEARRGEALDSRADIWSLGMLLSSLLAGPEAARRRRQGPGSRASAASRSRRRRITARSGPAIRSPCKRACPLAPGSRATSAAKA